MSITIEKQCRTALSLGLALFWAASCQAAGKVDTDREQVAAAAQDFLEEKATLEGLLKPEVSITVMPAIRPMKLCVAPLEVTPADVRHFSRMRFSATCNASGERQEYVVRATLTAEVIVASSSLTANQLIADNDVVLMRKDVTQLDDAFSDPQLAIGFASRRSLREGQVVQKKWLLAPTLVKRGQLLDIMAVNGSIEVRVAGEAQDSGRRGEIIRVRNISTGRIIRARVLDAAKVEPVDNPASITRSED